MTNIAIGKSVFVYPTDVDDMRFHGIVNDRIIASYKGKGSCVVRSATINFDGVIQTCNIPKPKDLVPYNNYTELKKVQSEGAEIEAFSESTRTWINVNVKYWHQSVNYRIRGGISIHSWNVHKETIKKYWNREPIEAYTDTFGWHDAACPPNWYADMQYRAKAKPIKMTIEEIEKKLNISNLEIVKT